MDAEKEPRSGWETKQVAGIAVLCFVFSGVMGYLFNAPSATSGQTASAGAAHQTRQQSQPSPEQLQHMAEKKAEPLLAKLRENPNDPAVLAELGKNYMYVRDFAKSAEYYERSAQLKPDARVLTTLGGVYHLAGSDDKAIDAWQRAVKVQPGYADALYNLGMVQWKAKSDPQAAIKAWTQLLKANPDHPQRLKVEEMIARAKEHANGTVTR